MQYFLNVIYKVCILYVISLRKLFHNSAFFEEDSDQDGCPFNGYFLRRNRKGCLVKDLPPKIRCVGPHDYPSVDKKRHLDVLVPAVPDKSVSVLLLCAISRADGSRLEIASEKPSHGDPGLPVPVSPFSPKCVAPKAVLRVVR